MHLEIYAKNYSRPSTKTFVHDANALLSLEARVTLLKSIFANDPVKRAFLDLLKEFEIQAGDNHLLYPSWSGKTTLLQHLCCESFPAAFTLFSKRQGIHQPVQQVYKPFTCRSAEFVQAQMEDLGAIYALFEPKYKKTTSREVAEMERKMRTMNQPVQDNAKLSSRLKV